MARRATPSLPRTLEALKGLRYAALVRESTKGQFDTYGPDAQAEQIRRAGERYGMVGSGLVWTIAASGWKAVWTTPAWAEMMAAAAAGAFDLLIVGYASRFSRNLKQTLIAIEDHLHPAGVAVLFADERLLSSDPDHWDSFVREAHEAESYVRKLSKRVGEGYAAKRRRLGVPGGNRAPFGTRREGRPSVLRVEAAELAVVREAYTLAAGGLTDREVAGRLGLRLSHVHELLTNPFYAGRLSDGAPSALGPLVDAGTWDRVQELRQRYSRRHRGTATRRQYALSGLLACGACGRRLTGHVERYRHVDACAAFRAAAVRPRRSDGRYLDRRCRGESYGAALYDRLVEAALGRVRANASLVAAAVAGAASARPPARGQLALRRVAREREAATRRYLADRDAAALQAEMARLDAEERAAAEAPAPGVTAAQARRYLADLARLWREAPVEGRRAVAAAAFERVDAVGLDLVLRLTPEAERHGWREAFGDAPLEVELPLGRGTVTGTVRLAPADPATAESAA